MCFKVRKNFKSFIIIIDLFLKKAIQKEQKVKVVDAVTNKHLLKNKNRIKLKKSSKIFSISDDLSLPREYI